MNTKLAILQGDSQEVFICPSEILKEYGTLFTHTILWSDIFSILKWIQKKKGCKAVDMKYTPGQKLEITGK